MAEKQDGAAASPKDQPTQSTSQPTGIAVTPVTDKLRIYVGGERNINMERFFKSLQDNDELSRYAISENRGDKYGDRWVNFGIAASLRATLRDGVRSNVHRKPGPKEMLCLEEAMLKFARIATGRVVEDNYDDIINYVKYAKEFATKGEVNVRKKR
tara:strand:+ start:9759 stop:10226 length:468 start_codon:yes stop_codon:yes gene_type:complete